MRGNKNKPAGKIYNKYFNEKEKYKRAGLEDRNQQNKKHTQINLGILLVFN